MGNILNHNRDILQFDICQDDYWDFHVSLKMGGDLYEGLTERCLSTYIDISDVDCIWNDGNIMSNSAYKWEQAINNGEIVFQDFGFTSVDNGRTYYDFDRITNKEFLDIFTNTQLNFEKDDLRLCLYKVRGNHKIYDYTSEFSFEDDFLALKLNGGFYQGFFCANDGNEYKILPTDIGTGWTFEFVLKKEDFINEKTRLIDKYEENKGIFFYIGTRAENKWFERYNIINQNLEVCEQKFFGEEYVENDYASEDTLNNVDYFKELVNAYEYGTYFSDGYITDESGGNESAFDDSYLEDNKVCTVCDNYVTDEYYETDIKINTDAEIHTSDGYEISQPRENEIKTDNKFPFFDRTKKGLTAKCWDENTELILSMPKRPDIGNLFMLMDRTCNGYTIKKVEELIYEKSKEYNILADLYRNALGFQIKDDGSIGYKYLVKDCESEEENYKIESEFSNANIVNEKEWFVVHITLKPVKHKDKSFYECLTSNPISDTMQIYIYVNGRLVLVSKVLPILNLRNLNDAYTKQEGVPFNLSLGGGTQGLAEMVTLNYKKRPRYVLPLEKEFGGSFIGYLKSFRFYTCPINFYEIRNNYHYFIKNK